MEQQYMHICRCLTGAAVWQCLDPDLRFQLSPRSLCEESGLPIHGGSAGCGGGTVGCTHQVKSSNMIKSYQFGDN